MSRPTSPSCKLVSINQVKGLIEALNDLTSQEAAVMAQCENRSPFSVGKVPKINLEAYFQRMLKYCNLQEGTYIALMIYLDRAAEKVEFSGFNIHRLILASLVCAVKYTSDICNNNFFFAKVGGISPYEMCSVEAAFLEILDYNLYISDRDYNKYSTFIH